MAIGTFLLRSCECGYAGAVEVIGERLVVVGVYSRMFIPGSLYPTK